MSKKQKDEATVSVTNNNESTEVLKTLKSRYDNSQFINKAVYLFVQITGFIESHQVQFSV